MYKAERIHYIKQSGVRRNVIAARVCPKAEGIEWMACFPSNPIISEVAKVGIRPVAFRHERGAVMAATARSRL